VESHANDLNALLTEMYSDRQSERAGRLIDGEGSDSMESKKTEGYF
jgi:sulfate adenylyltransferase subunit 2